MSNEEQREYERRIAALERRVAMLEARAPAVPVIGRPPVPRTPRPLRSPLPQGEDWFRSGEGWLGRAGVLLVVLGLVFLFRYAVDQGWLSPPLRIAAGLLTGSALLTAGLRFFPDRRRYRQILMAGGLTILFISGLAASELYQLVSGGVALLFHGLVAVGGFTIAARQRDTALASVASVGALAPPALLLADAVPGAVFWLYLLLMVAWSALLVARHTPGAFGLLAMAAALLAMFQPVPADAAVRMAALSAVLAVWIGFAALPLLRSVLAWAVPYRSDDDHSLWLRLVQPLLVTVLLGAAVHGQLRSLGYGFDASMAVAALGFTLLALWLRHAGTKPAEAAPASDRAVDVLRRSDDFAAAAAAAAGSLAALALAALDPALRFVAVSAIGVVCYAAAPRLGAPLLALLAHALFTASALEFAGRIEAVSAAPAFDPFALGLLGITALAGVMLRQVRTTTERLAYGAAVYVAVHVLLATELGAVPGWQWLGSASWAVVGSTLVLAGLARQQLRLQQAGLLSLGLLVLRLFTFDLARTDVGVRIVLFLVCGFGFLALSYLFRGSRSASADTARQP